MYNIFIIKDISDFINTSYGSILNALAPVLMLERLLGFWSSMLVHYFGTARSHIGLVPKAQTL